MHKCPYCREKIKDFLFDIEKGKGKCVLCGREYDLQQVVSEKEAIHLCRILQGKAKEKIMQLYNLEEKPKVTKTPKLILILFSGTSLLMVVGLASILYESFSNFLICILGIILFSLSLVQIYRETYVGMVVKKISGSTVSD